MTQRTVLIIKDSRAVSRASHRALNRASHRASHLLAHSSAHRATALPTMFVKAPCASANGIVQNELRPKSQRARGNEARKCSRRQQREEAAGHRLARRDHIDALQERLAQV